MRFGLYAMAQHPSSLEPRVALEQHIEQVRLARDGGFDTIYAGQHYLSQPYWMLQPLPFLARLAAEAPGLRFALGIVLVAHLNPVEVAETVATMDVICGGRVVLGIGLGYRREEDEAFGLPRRRIPIFHEKLDVVRRLLEGETVTAEGLGYRLEGASLALLPVQRPRPPIWMAAVSDEAVLRAARTADTWFMGPLDTTDTLERQLAFYLEARDGVRPAELPVVRDVLVAETDAEAIRIARPHLMGKYATYAAWGQSDDLRAGWDELARGRFIVGSPATAVAELQELRERLGVTDVAVRAQWPGLPHADVARTLRLLASDVIPALQPTRALA